MAPQWRKLQLMPAGVSAPAGVALVELSLDCFSALAAGDLIGANAVSDVELTPYFVRPTVLRLWRMRRDQLLADPIAGSWVTRAVLDPELDEVVGHAGFHGPPDDHGMVELGYSIDPARRRRGYARACLATLMRVAAADAQVMTVRASISPNNIASRNLIQQYGFIENGEQWDDEDGLEIIFETPS